MALPVAQQVRYWTIAAVLLLAVLWFLGNVILPFLLGMAIAYCLDPVADRLEEWGLPRVVAVALITVASMMVFVLVLLLVLPTLVGQTSDLINLLPELVRQLQDFVITRLPALTDADSTLRQSLEDLAGVLKTQALDLVQSAVTSISSLFGLMTLLVITPVVSVYLLLDWDHMKARIDDLMPRDHAPAIREILVEIDHTLAGFIRGQGTVCLILGIYYSAALMLVGLDFGLIVGAVAGLLTFIPWIGALVGGALAIGLALFQFWGDWAWIAVVAAIFFSGQMIEGNVLTPKLVGSSVGLHPVWLLFALSVFGALFGFVGLLVAVPLAAVIGVVVRFFIGQYKTGLLYRGLEGRDAAREALEAGKTGDDT